MPSWSYFILLLSKINKNYLGTLISCAQEESNLLVSPFLFLFFLSAIQKTSKFSGAVAGFNDILQILVNISAASHFYFLRNTQLSTICSWWFTALELLKLLHNFILRDFYFCYKATFWFPVDSVLGTGISSSSSVVKMDTGNLISFLCCSTFSEVVRAMAGWLTGTENLQVAFCFLQSHFFYTSYTAWYLHFSDNFCTLPQEPLAITDHVFEGFEWSVLS